MSERDHVPGIAEVLRSAREAAGISQQEAGERAGVHHISIAKFETAKRVPTVATLYKLAGAYGVSVCDLLPRDMPSGEAPRPEPPIAGDRPQGKGK